MYITKKTGLILSLIFIVLLAVFFLFKPDIKLKFAEKIGNTKQVYNTTISGVFPESQIWEGEILISGDVLILGDLTILPGTIVKFMVQDDQFKGYETPADGYNDLDPTRLLSYGKSHSSLTIQGKLNASGTSEEKIIFTSVSDSPKIADWEAIYPQGDESIIEYAVIEYSRNGISPGDEPTPNSIFRNNIIKQTFWGAISTGFCSCQIYDNEIYECGHEGIDVQGGSPRIERNRIHDCHTGIVVLRGNAAVKNNIMENVGNGIHIGKDASPLLINNTIKLAQENEKKEWRYDDFAYLMFGDPIGTPILTKVYSVEGEARYAVPAYRIEPSYVVDLPYLGEWIAYGWKNEKWEKIEIDAIELKLKLPLNYSMYVLIPNPSNSEKDAEKFNKEHYDIYKIMAV